VLELEWREAAREDLLSIVEYIAQDNVDAALALVTEIEEKAERLRHSPSYIGRGACGGRARWWCGQTTWSCIWSQRLP
jgi:toxin ParE1/3/4